VLELCCWSCGFGNCDLGLWFGVVVLELRFGSYGWSLVAGVLYLECCGWNLGLENYFLLEPRLNIAWGGRE
jgi:hypothetical protein